MKTKITETHTFKILYHLLLISVIYGGLVVGNEGLQNVLQVWSWLLIVSGFIISFFLTSMKDEYLEAYFKKGEEELNRYENNKVLLYKVVGLLESVSLIYFGWVWTGVLLIIVSILLLAGMKELMVKFKEWKGLKDDQPK